MLRTSNTFALGRSRRTLLVMLMGMSLWTYVRAETAPSGLTISLPEATSRHLRIEGTITPDLVEGVRQWLQQTREAHPGANIHVHLNSMGGDGISGMHIGLLLRQSGAHTFVEDKCASACAFIFLGGVERHSQGEQIGIHAAQVRKHWRWLGLVPLVYTPDPAADPKARQLQAQGEALFAEYARTLCLDEQLVALIRSTPPHQLRWLNQAELDTFNVNTQAGAPACTP